VIGKGFEIPVSHEVRIEHNHTKSIQAIAIDRAGTKMITGALDY